MMMMMMMMKIEILCFFIEIIKCIIKIMGGLLYLPMDRPLLAVKTIWEAKVLKC